MTGKNKNSILNRGSKTLALLVLVTFMVVAGGALLLKKVKNNRPLNQYGTNVYARVMSRHDEDGQDTSARKTYADIEYEFKHQVYNESIEDNSQRFAIDDTLILNITPAETIVAGTHKDGEDMLGSDTGQGKLF